MAGEAGRDRDAGDAATPAARGGQAPGVRGGGTGAQGGGTGAQGGGTGAAPAGRTPAGLSATDLGLPESVPCPFCDSRDTELHSAFGSALSVVTYWCRGCHTAFEWIKR